MLLAQWYFYICYSSQLVIWTIYIWTQNTCSALYEISDWSVLWLGVWPTHELQCLFTRVWGGESPHTAYRGVPRNRGFNLNLSCTPWAINCLSKNPGTLFCEDKLSRNSKFGRFKLCRYIWKTYQKTYIYNYYWDQWCSSVWNVITMVCDFHLYHPSLL